MTQRDTRRGRVRITFERAAGAGDLVAGLPRPVAGQRARQRRRRCATASGERAPAHSRARRCATGENTARGPLHRAHRAGGGQHHPLRRPQRTARTYLYTLLVPPTRTSSSPASTSRTSRRASAGGIVRAARLEGAGQRRPRRATPRRRGDAGRFAETEPISTYLIAFAAGPWAHVDVGARRRRARSRCTSAPAARAEADADSLHRAPTATRSRWLERYFGVPFPFSKFDFVLAPAFPFGGMEHPGAIFYNEDAFIFREPPTLTQRLGARRHHLPRGRAPVVRRPGHHALVRRPVAQGRLRHLHGGARCRPSSSPARERVEDVLPAQQAAGVRGRRRPRGTTPVWQALGNLDQAKSNYGAIVYNKAPAVLKQLDYPRGRPAFQRGAARCSCSRHAYGNATWRDLLRRVQETLRACSLEPFGAAVHPARGDAAWSTAAGGARADDRARWRCAQRPARDCRGDPGGCWPSGRRCGWPTTTARRVVLPVAARAATSEVVGGARAPGARLRVRQRRRLRLRPVPPRRAQRARAMAEHVGEADDGLLRAMLWGALWDQVRESRMEPARFAAHRAARAAAGARRADRRARSWAAAPRRSPATPRTRTPRGSSPSGSALLAGARGDASLGYGLRKASLDALVGTARTAAGRALLREYLAGTRPFDGRGRKQPTRWGIVKHLLALGEPEPDALIAAESARDTTPDAGATRLRRGRGAPGRGAKARYFARLPGRSRPERGVGDGGVGRLQRARMHADLTLRYLRPSLDRLAWIRDNRRIFFLPRWIGAFMRRADVARGAGHRGPLPGRDAAAARRHPPQGAAVARRAGAHGPHPPGRGPRPGHRTVGPAMQPHLRSMLYVLLAVPRWRWGS